MSIALAGRPAEHPLNIERPKRTLFQQIWKERTAYLLVTPALLGYLIFWAYPVLFAFVASFTRYDAFTMKV
jgi:ABC-type sugar transport system permease subunit